MSRHVTFDESCFPSPVSVPVKRPSNPQILDSLLNLPFQRSSTDEYTADKVDNFSLAGEEFYDAVEEQPARRIRVIGPRHPILNSANVSTNNILPYRKGAHKTIESAIPKSFEKAAESGQFKECKNAIAKELDNLTRLNVWAIRDAKDKDHPITSTWVFKVQKR
ncbi:hypothetical protein O181_049976 [Austropuccinia psidii MF-1]|uniref:Reverse transcriptase Ty1/copia-type domain-containing protein n=1 Tax=Austropuccinia psidii MF-1 TaxID=1389203 RepID=A0A9Q3E0Y8_9BASI|nr:hypothetical protein [Austropuccinia psidii MF-1]